MSDGNGVPVGHFLPDSLGASMWKIGDKARVINPVLGPAWVGRTGRVIALNPKDMFPIVLLIGTREVCFYSKELERA